MINELKLIADGLEETGEDIELINRGIYSIGGKEALHVFLNNDSTIDSIEYMNADDLSIIWGMRTSNQDQFPNIKITQPLITCGNGLYSAYYAFANAKKVKDKEKMKEEFTKLCNIEEVDEEKFLLLDNRLQIEFLLERYTVGGKINLQEFPKKSYRKSILARLELLKKSDDKDVQIVSELYKRYSNFGNEGVELLIELQKKIVEALSCKPEIPTRVLLNILYGEKPILKKKGILETPDISRSIIILDYKPYDDIDEFVFTPKRKSMISSFLNENVRTKPKCGKSFLTGNEINLITDKFPEKNLGKGKSVSKVIILAKFDDSGQKSTVQRYKRSGVDSYLLGESEGSRLGEALFKITRDEHKGKIWDSIPSERKEQDLLIAFCKSSDAIITPLVMGNDLEDIDDYCDITETVINSFKGGNLTFDDVVDFVVLRKVDDGNQKVIYSISKPIKNLQIAAKEWVIACKNIPNLQLKAIIKKKIDFFSPWAIAPIDVVWLTKSKYIRDGLSSTPVSAVSFSDAMKLFLSNSENVKSLATRCIAKFGNQVEPLFEYCALSKTQSVFGKKAHLKIIPDNNSKALRMITLLGVLLYKSGKKKEVYMSSFAYQLGQLCSAMDELHIGYCKSIRGGDIPNVLIGNSTYNVALQNPIKSLALLASRIKPYAVWAKKETVGGITTEDNAVKNGLWSYRWISTHSTKIISHFSDEKIVISDTYKAELMLGYLAGRPFEGKIDTNNEGGEK